MVEVNNEQEEARKAQAKGDDLGGVEVKSMDGKEFNERMQNVYEHGLIEAHDTIIKGLHEVFGDDGKFTAGEIVSMVEAGKAVLMMKILMRKSGMTDEEAQKMSSEIIKEVAEKHKND